MIRAVVSALTGRRLELRKSTARERVRLLDASVRRLSLCRRGKNGFTTLYKADGVMEIQTLVKAVDEGALLAVMYAPERADHDGHVADPAVVQKMLHSLMKSGAELDIEHDGKILPREKAYVAEAFIVQKSDPRFQDWKLYDGSSAGDLTGAAAVRINIDDQALRDSRKRGEWDGVSLLGSGYGVPERASLTKSDTLEPTMTPEQLKQIMDGFAAGLAGLQTSLVKALTPEKPAEPTKPAAEEAPKFEGDPANPADLETFEKAIRAYEFRKAVASGKLTADQIAELRKSITEPKPSDAEADIKPGDSPEVRKLKYDLFKAQRRTNAPASAGPAPERSQIELDVAAGLELAKSLNGDEKAPAFVWNVH